MDNKIMENRLLIGFLYCKDANEYSTIDRIMWKIYLMEFDELGSKYFNFSNSTVRKIMVQSIIRIAIDLRLKKLYSFEDNLHEILKIVVFKKMVEIKRLRQKYSFAEHIKRREEKLRKKELKNNDSVPSFAY